MCEKCSEETTKYTFLNEVINGISRSCIQYVIVDVFKLTAIGYEINCIFINFF